MIAGALAKAIRPGKDPQGCFVTTFIGIMGAVFGGYITTALGWGHVNKINLYSLLVATVGAIIFLAIHPGSY